MRCGLEWRTLEVATVAVWLLALVAGARAAAVTRGTTLRGVIPWVMVALTLWLCISGLGLGTTSAVAPARGYLTHLAAVLSLVPAIAVLGARRPTMRAWPWFVLGPMVVVLSWPVVAITAATGWSRPLELETAHAIIFALVVVMGYGNYMGTRLTLPTLLAGAALIATVWTLTTSATHDVAVRWGILGGCRLALGIAVLAAAWLLRQPSRAQSRFDRVWDEFVTLYGLVWSRRLLDRLRLLAAQQNWACDVTPTGFVFTAGPSEETAAQVEHALRWLLRRFVDPDWLNERFESAADANRPNPTLDV